MERERTSSAGWSTEQRLRALLYLISMLSDFASFIIVFSVSRSLADQNVGPTYLGIVGAGFSFCAGTGAILSGYLSGKFDGRVVFLIGSSCVVAAGLACSELTPQSKAFLPAYWVLGLGMGILYPPLIGWLNQDQDAHANRSGGRHISVAQCWLCRGTISGAVGL